MPPQLLEPSAIENHVPIDALLKRLALSLCLGVFVALIYHFTRRRPRAETTTFVITLILLTMLITLVTDVIGNNVARAFSLVGSLAIVRFRTVVEDTRDTAFVIFAVALGLTVGAGFLEAAIIGGVVVGIVAVCLAFLDLRQPPPSREGIMQLKIGIGFAPDAVIKPALEQFLHSVRLISATTAKQGSALELTYQIRLRRGAELVPLIFLMNQQEGVQSVELKQS